MKTYDERTNDILSKLAVAKRRRKAVITMVSLCCCMALIAGILLIPLMQHSGNPGNPSNPPVQLQQNPKPGTTNNPIYQNPHQNSGVINLAAYAPLVQQLSEIDIMLELNEDDLQVLPEATPDAAPPTSGNNATPGFEFFTDIADITDNQVKGVTEADLIKRSSKHIYYLRENLLTVYSINGKSSEKLGSYEIGSELNKKYNVNHYEKEMYLSRDGKTVTVITSCYYTPESQRYLYILSLDVADPEDIQINGSCFLKGSYETSRLVGNDLYVISRLYLDSDMDLDNGRTFLPGYGRPRNETYLSMEDIFIPDSPAKAMYTVVTKLDNATLQVEDSVALLSYAGKVYMSQENIYLVRNYTQTSAEGNINTQTHMSEITRLSYDDSGMEMQGCFSLEGSVDDQYWLDEYDGILRVVTTIDRQVWSVWEDPNDSSGFANLWQTSINANLYCIDLADHSIRAKVEQFAPEGESVRSVRFDGDAAYVCTSIVLRDPVFFFDLSNLDDISYKDTGTIDGFSMSLVDFADGFLMGIGYGDDFDTLKIEMYRESSTTVDSHCVYEYENCWFSEEYKSYYIDRKNQLIGLGVRSYDDGVCRYILLRFDGYELVELLEVEIPGDPDTMRAVYIDGYLYIFGEDFRVEFVG